MGAMTRRRPSLGFDPAFSPSPSSPRTSSRSRSSRSACGLASREASGAKLESAQREYVACEPVANPTFAPTQPALIPVAATLFAMRRWFAILMLVLLPFQFTWAAVASYCGHERGVAAQHFGHHEHQHHADSGAAQADGDGSGKTLGGNDFDCANCHGSCSGIVSPLTGLMSLDVATQPAMLAAELVRTLVHSPPERPQWAPLA